MNSKLDQEPLGKALLAITTGRLVFQEAAYCGDEDPPVFPELLVQPKNRFKPKTASRIPAGLRWLGIGLFILGTR